MIIVDTGPLVALVNETDRAHTACQEWYRSVDPRHLIVPAPVLSEVCYLVEKHLGPAVEADFIDDLANGSYGNVVGPSTSDLRRMAELIRQYAGFPLGGCDASVVALAERYSFSRICTLDRRHFTAIRPRHIPAFELLPEALP